MRTRKEPTPSELPGRQEENQEENQDKSGPGSQLNIAFKKGERSIMPNSTGGLSNMNTEN